MTQPFRLMSKPITWVSMLTLGVLGVYLLPHLFLFSRHPVLLMSEESARSLSSFTGPERDRTFQRLITKNIQGVVFRQETLQDLESSGRAFVASGEELIRLFKLQSVASYYAFEQIKDKNLNPGGSYVFFSEQAVYQRVLGELKRQLAPGTVDVFERGIFRGDASFPDNFILESSIPSAKLRQMPLGWPVERIRDTLDQLQARRGDTLWPVFWAEDPQSLAAPIKMDLGSGIPPAIALNPEYLRFPYLSVRIIHEPSELVGARPSPRIERFLSVPRIHPHVSLGLAIAWVVVCATMLNAWISWSRLLAAGLLVAALALTPSQLDWTVQGICFLMPSAALLVWMSMSDKFRASLGQPLGRPLSVLRYSLWMVMFLGAPGWLLSTLLWEYPELNLARISEYGLIVVPLCAGVLFLSVWGIQVANRPLYLRNIRTGVEMALAGFILIKISSFWILACASSLAWAHWLVLHEWTRGMPLEDAPGNYAAFFVASALTLKMFFVGSPVSAVVVMVVLFVMAASGAAIFLARSSGASSASS